MKKFTLMLLCVFAYATQTHAQFPAPYCGPLTNTSGTEPITLVNFAGINNTTNPDIGAVNPAHENFTAIVGSVFAGSTYSITLKGNTDGNYNTNLSVFIDWNQNNVFTDAGETYDVGSILNSTGVDAVQLVGNILVPSTAIQGNTRMRVVKRYNTSTTIFPTSCQVGTGFGQAEDYTLAVTVPSCIAPSSGLATITSSTTAGLSWTSGGAADSEIVVQAAGVGVPAAADNTGLNVTGSTTYAASGLTAATAYEFYVRAECTIGSSFSTWSGPYAFNTTLIPGCATLVSPADGATGVAITGTPAGIPLSWTAPTTGDAPTGYNIYFGTDPLALPLLGNTSALTVNITGIAFNVVYYWQAVPVNTAGEAPGCPVSSFTSQLSPGFCLSGPLYPALTFTPAICDGTTPNSIALNCYANEYANVNVVSGDTYRFVSSIATDFITISSDAGATAVAYGTTPLTWTATVTGAIRFYTHVNDQCIGEAVNREKSVVCGIILANATFNVSNFNAFPNPVKNMLNLSYDKNISHVAVFNLLGQEVISKSNSTKEVKIDLSQLANGTYMVKVTADNAVNTIKVIKQ